MAETAEEARLREVENKMALLELRMASSVQNSEQAMDRITIRLDNMYNNKLTPLAAKIDALYVDRHKGVGFWAGVVFAWGCVAAIASLLFAKFWDRVL